MRIDLKSLACPTIVLEPLADEHAAQLAIAAGSPETFRYFTRIPTPFDAFGFMAYGRLLIEHPDVIPFAARDVESGDLVGMTTYCDIRRASRCVEIGWTWYAPRARGTTINPTCKYLLLRHAFEMSPFTTPDGQPANAVRVQLKTDERNAHSRQAIKKLGARFEGILRNQAIMPNGHLRQTAMHAITPEDWPGVKAKLEARIKPTDPP